MLGLSRFFISSAWAQTMTYTQMNTGGEASAHYVKYMPLAILGLVIYFVFFHKNKK